MLINITDAAVSHLQKMVKQRHAKYFRLSVKKSGCNGYRYHPEIMQAANEGDIHLQMPQGLLVAIDPTCVPIVEGMTVDYVSKGVGQSQLQFVNPNVQSECGCGESFSIKGEQADGG